MDKHFDVIVLGAGIGGLGCAALLSHAGLKTLVLEKNNMIGGRCMSYKKNDCIIDTFIHMFACCEKGPFGEILEKTKMKDAIKFWHANPENKPVLLFGGKSFVYPDLAYATDEDMIETLRGLMLPEADFQAALRLNDDIYQMPLEKTHELDGLPYEAWLKNYSSNEALLSLHNHRSMLMGVVAMHEASTGEVIRMTQQWHLKRGVGYPMGGCQAIPDGFAKIIHQYGGDIRTGAAVKSILVEKGKATGVTLKNGEEIRGRAVVSNAGVRETVLKLVLPDIFSKAYLDYVEHLSCGAFGQDIFMNTFLNIKVLLKKPVIEAPVVWGIPVSSELPPIGAELDLSPNDENKREILDRFSIMLPIPSNMDPSLAPEGFQLLNFPGMMHDENADIARAVTYRINELDLIYPGVKENVLWWDVIKGAAIKGYSGRFQSDIVGLGQIVGQVGDERPSIESPVEGLFFVGADVGKDNIGTELAAQSALSALPLITKFLKSR
jgi:phytoene dehydrogenase-like protein